MEKSIDELQVLNEQTVANVIKECDESESVALIAMEENVLTGDVYRFFYDSVNAAFHLGCNASIEGFVMEDGTELEAPPTTIRPDYLMNPLTLHKGMFDSEESFIRHGVSLWTSYFLYSQFSSSYNQSFILYTIAQGVVEAEEGGGEIEVLRLESIRAVYDTDSRELTIYDGEEEVATRLVEKAESQEDKDKEMYEIVDLIHRSLTNKVNKDQ